MYIGRMPVLRQRATLRDFAIAGAALLLAAAPAPGQVVLSEIHYDPVGGSTNEFVELFNAGTNDVALGNWRLADGTALRLERASEVALSSDGERGATLLRGGVVVEVARQKAALTLALPHGSLSTVYGIIRQTGGAITVVFQPMTWSPVNTVRLPTRAKHRWSGAWPGMCRTSRAKLFPLMVSPSTSLRSGTKSGSTKS